MEWNSRASCAVTDGPDESVFFELAMTVERFPWKYFSYEVSGI